MLRLPAQGRRPWRAFRAQEADEQGEGGVRSTLRAIRAIRNRPACYSSVERNAVGGPVYLTGSLCFKTTHAQENGCTFVVKKLCTFTDPLSKIWTSSLSGVEGSASVLDRFYKVSKDSTGGVNPKPQTLNP